MHKLWDMTWGNDKAMENRACSTKYTNLLLQNVVLIWLVLQSDTNLYVKFPVVNFFPFRIIILQRMSGENIPSVGPFNNKKNLWTFQDNCF